MGYVMMPGDKEHTALALHCNSRGGNLGTKTCSAAISIPRFHPNQDNWWSPEQSVILFPALAGEACPIRL